MRKLSILFTAASLLFLVSCGDTETKVKDKVDEVTQEVQNEVVEVVEEVAALDLSAGEAIYNGKGTCFACHQANGAGLAPAFPPLANADYLLEDKTRAIKQTIYGAKEPLTVNGTEYPGGAMTTIEMTDQEVADVVNYILNSWGNNAGTVTVEEVKAAR